MYSQRGLTEAEYFLKHPIDKTLGNIQNLISRYGENITLKEAKERYTKDKASSGYKCPKCGGTGYIMKKINTYPSGLPDSGWVEQLEDRYYECDLCHGYGYTSIEYVPKTETKIIGYEERK